MEAVVQQLVEFGVAAGVEYETCQVAEQAAEEPEEEAPHPSPSPKNQKPDLVPPRRHCCQPCPEADPRRQRPPGDHHRQPRLNQLAHLQEQQWARQLAPFPWA